MAYNQTKKAAIKPPTTSGRYGINVKLAFFLVLISFMVYANTLKNGFAMDDYVMITYNTIVTKGVSAIPELFSTPHQIGRLIKSNDEYRPLSLVMFSIIYEASGNNPMPFHFISLLLFAGCVVLLFLFLNELFDRKRTVVAFIASLLFALHPIHTEVVANIKSSDELLCFFFAFLSLLVFTRYAQNGKIALLLTGAGCYLLSLLSKETAITFLLIIPVALFLYKGADRKRSIYVTISIVLVAMVFLIIRFSVLNAYHANGLTDIDIIENALAKHGLSFESRIATAILILGYYVKLLVIPYPLICDYSYSTIPYAHFSDPLVIVSLAIYLLLVVFCILRLVKKGKDPYAFGILFYLANIALVSNVLFLIKSTAGERFLFFPSVGFCLVVALLLEKWVKKELGTDLSVLKHPKLSGILIPLSVICIIIIVSRNNDWADNFTLYSTDVKKAPDNSRLNYLAGYVYLDREKEERDPTARHELAAAAIAHFARTLAMYPEYYNAACDMGVAYFDIAMYDSAAACYIRAINIDPAGVDAVNNLSGLYITGKQYHEAIGVCEKAIKFNPGNVIAYANAGYAYLNMGKPDSAIYYLNDGIKVDPGFRGFYELMAAAYNAMHIPDSVRKYDGIVHGF
jgi:protein O-mannosyl-transferase